MKPNILFLFPDQWRGDWWSGGGRGVPVHTPTLAGLAESGTTFTSAITPSPLCAPARACIARGAAYSAEGVVDNGVDYPVGAPSVYQALREAGYHVAGCGKFDLHKAHYSWGPDGTHRLDEWGFSAGIDNEGKIDGVEAYKEGTPGPYLRFLAERGKAQAHVDDFARRMPHGTFPTPLSPEEYCDNWVNQNALDLLSSAPADRPWFLQVNYTGPHSPFDITAEMHEWYRDVDFDGPINGGAQEVDHLAIRRHYAAMIQNIDAAIGKLLDHPRIREQRENTMIAFASDHGEMLGDHGRFGKSVPHNGSVHVPFVVQGAGVSAGRVVDDPVTILDLPATFLDAAGVSELPGMDSQSLVSCLAGGAVPRELVTSALCVTGKPELCWRLALDSEFKYVAWSGGSEALFQRSDYGELDDVSAAHPAETARLREAAGGA